VQDANNCALPVTDSVIVIINPRAVFQFSSNKLAGCAPLEVELSSLSVPNNVTYNWTFNGSTVSTLSGGPVIVTNPGTYDVALTVTTDKGCDSTMIKPGYITVYPTPVADIGASPETVTLLHPEYVFTDLTQDSIVNRLWTFGDGDSAILKTVAHMYADTGRYGVTLWVQNQYSCIDTAFISVYVEPDFSLYVPTAFTPNGDGKNDVFVPVGVGIDKDNSSFMIFDRWGLLIYNGNNFVPWNGKVGNSGEIVQEDVYIWIVRAKNILGEDMGGSFKGTVSVLK
jgi:gliding motility-associated-like protein